MVAVGETPTGPMGDYQQQCKAPGHIVEMLRRVLRYPSTPAAPAGTGRYAQAALYEARAWADRIWAEAFHAGAVWGVTHNPAPTRIEVTPERFDELKRECG